MAKKTKIAISTVPTNGDDVLTGTAGADEIYGHGGNDIIRGLGGDDRLFGGRDVLSGLPPSSNPDEDDTIYGGPGNDHLYGGLGSDNLRGGPGDDYICADCNNEGGANVFFEWGDNQAWGEDGNDTLMGGGDTSLLYGGKGDDILSSGTFHGISTMLGGPGSDRFFASGWERDAVMTGGAGADLFTVTAGDAIDDLTMAVTDFRPREGDRLKVFLRGEAVNPLDHPDFTVTVEPGIGKKAKPSTVIVHHPQPGDPPLLTACCLVDSHPTTIKLVGYVGIADEHFILPPDAPSLF